MYELKPPVMKCRTAPLYVVLSVCGPVYTLVYSIVISRSFCSAVCVCLWFCLRASVSHSDGLFILLCCLCLLQVRDGTTYKKIRTTKTKAPLFPKQLFKHLMIITSSLRVMWQLLNGITFKKFY
jgi:hypothetical protein